MGKKIIIYVLSFFLLVSSICNSVFLYRLEQSRQQLEYVRIELERSRNNYKVITDGLGRTAEILSESASTVQDLRKQLSAIRENYKAMEDYLNDIYK